MIPSLLEGIDSGYVRAMLVIAILLVAGFVLLVSEVFLPGMVAGTVGAICLAIGVGLGFQEFGPVGGSGLLAVVLLGLGVGLISWVYWFPRLGISKPFVSEGQIGDIGTEKPELVGCEGIAMTPLRPSGIVLIDRQQVDVVTEGEMISRDERVKVVAVEGIRVVVRRV